MAQSLTAFTPNPSGNILIIDSDENIRELLSINLGSEGFGVGISESAYGLVGILDPAVFNLVIVDAMDLPYTGLDFIEDLKDNPATEGIGVFLCTTPHRQSMAVDALDSGADDFIAKPFSLRELLARVKSYMRRHAGRQNRSNASTLLTLHDIGVDRRSKTATKMGMPLPLSKTEYAILELLMKNVNTYVSRAEILSSVWNDPDQQGINERIVDTNISRLRKKLGDTASYLVNRTGLGYMITDHTPAAQKSF